MRRKFFIGRVVRHWNRLLREVATAPRLSIQKTFGQLLVWSQELELMVLVGPFQPRIFYDCMKSGRPRLLGCGGGGVRGICKAKGPHAQQICLPLNKGVSSERRRLLGRGLQPVLFWIPVSGVMSIT